jgi:ATP-dependent Clp protease adaptor protein ClpS
MAPSTLTPPRERTSRPGGTALGKPWRVIVRNDDHNTFQGLANRIHNTGRAIVWTGHKETAELYWTQLEGFGLTMAPLEQ